MPAAKDYDKVFKTFSENHNQVSDLLTTEELNLYRTIDYPDNIPILHKALKRKLETEPDYEVWVPIKYYKYSVLTKDKQNLFSSTKFAFISNKGNVYHLRKETKAVKGNKQTNGYMASRFRVLDEIVRFQIHRAVACNFIPIPTELKELGYYNLEVNHKDTVKSHNDFQNLEWCTSKQNSEHSIVHGLREYKQGKDHYATKPVLGEVLIEGPYKGFKFIRNGKAEIEEIAGESSPIMQAAKGKLQQAKGCKWSYATDQDIIDYSDNEIPKELQDLIRKHNSNWKPPILATRFKDFHRMLIIGGPEEIKALGFTPQQVYTCCNFHIEGHRGFHFRRLTEKDDIDLIQSQINNQKTTFTPLPRFKKRNILATRVSDNFLILMIGKKEIIAEQFEPSMVYERLKLSVPKEYKGYIFKEITEEEVPEILKLIETQTVTK